MKKLNARSREKAPPPSAAIQESSAPFFLERFALPLALCLILIGAIRIVSTYTSLSVTTDEPYHFSCGLDYLASGRV